MLKISYSSDRIRMVKQTIRNPYREIEVMEIGPTEEEKLESWRQYWEARTQLAREEEMERERRRIESMNREAEIILNGFSSDGNNSNNQGSVKLLSGGQQEQYLKNKQYIAEGWQFSLHDTLLDRGII